MNEDANKQRLEMDPATFARIVAQENERLREALRVYACTDECANCYGPVQGTKHCGMIARAALGEDK